MLGEFDNGAGLVRGAIVKDFLSELDTRTGEIHKAMAARDFPALSSAAHQLKGAAMNTCAARLAQVCERTEMRARAEDPEAFQDDGTLDQVVQATREALTSA